LRTVRTAFDLKHVVVITSLPPLGMGMGMGIDKSNSQVEYTVKLIDNLLFVMAPLNIKFPNKTDT
jgi:hypothetical protein